MMIGHFYRIRAEEYSIPRRMDSTLYVYWDLKIKKMAFTACNMLVIAERSLSLDLLELLRVISTLHTLVRVLFLFRVRKYCCLRTRNLVSFSMLCQLRVARDEILPNTSQSLGGPNMSSFSNPKPTSEWPGGLPWFHFLLCAPTKKHLMRNQNNRMHFRSTLFKYTALHDHYYRMHHEQEFMHSIL